MADTLLLNTDGAPVSLLPLSTLNWQEAIKYMVLEKAHVLDWHEDWIVRSERWSTPVPSVMMLHEYMKPKAQVRLTKKNVFMRDGWVCQYCSDHLQESDCTLDHVLPISRGGKTTWENSVTACKPCNYRKADKLGMRPKKIPHRPTYFELVERRKSRLIHSVPEVWRQFLG